MENKGDYNINFLVTQAYEVICRKSGRIYLEERSDRKAIAHIFLDEKARNEFVKEHEGTTGKGPTFQPTDKLVSNYFAQGADIIFVHGQKGQIDLELTEDRLPLLPYNHELRKTISLLIQTKQKKYIRRLPECMFLVPVMISKKTWAIYYCMAKNDDQKQGNLYVVFTDYGEFIAWKKSQKQSWHPLMIDYQALKGIAKNAGVLIDPESEHIVIGKELLINPNS